MPPACPGHRMDMPIDVFMPDTAGIVIFIQQVLFR